MNQLSFLDVEKPKPTGEILRDRGIQKALDHAEEVNAHRWQAKALDFLYLYALNHDHFSGEMVRMEAKGIVPDAPSARAWGAILLTGARKGWIRQACDGDGEPKTIKVYNPKAHKANAALWESLIRRE